MPYYEEPSCGATLEDLEALWRPLTAAERSRAEALLPVTMWILEQEAARVKRNIYDCNPFVVKSVIVDIVSRTLMTSTNQETLTQFSQTAGPYTASGTYLVPGGGLFIKKSELARLGLRRQRIGVIDFYGQPESD